MEIKLFNDEHLDAYRQYLVSEERASATIEKYMRDISAFLKQILPNEEITKERILLYKKELSEKYKFTSANSMLIALNQFFGYFNRKDLQVKLFKIQHNAFRLQQAELTQDDYKKLVHTAKQHHNERLSLLIQTICNTGIRVSEHSFITVEAVKSGNIRIYNKGKERFVFLSKGLQVLLMNYCRRKHIKNGPVFITNKGKPMNRCNIWTEMKALSKDAGVEPQKIFPHNLRHLFALTFYKLEKDVVRLADLLGHSSIETTRIYTSTSKEECVHSLTKLHLLFGES